MTTNPTPWHIATDSHGGTMATSIKSADAPAAHERDFTLGLARDHLVAIMNTPELARAVVAFQNHDTVPYDIAQAEVVGDNQPAAGINEVLEGGAGSPPRGRTRRRRSARRRPAPEAHATHRARRHDARA